MSKRVKKPKFSTFPKKLAQLHVHDVRVFAALLINEIHFRCETRPYLDLSGFLTDSLQAIFTLLGGI